MQASSNRVPALILYTHEHFHGDGEGTCRPYALPKSQISSRLPDSNAFAVEGPKSATIFVTLQ
jgi:hypothetical protein